MTDAERLLTHVGTLLEVFLVNERAFPTAEGRVSYNPQEFKLLGKLHFDGPQRPTDLAAALQVRPTTLSSVIARLIRRGLIEKVPHPEDGRAQLVRLTAEGLDLRQAIHRQDLRNMEAILGALDPDEQALMLTYLEKVARHLRALEAEAAEQAGGA